MSGPVTRSSLREAIGDRGAFAIFLIAIVLRLAWAGFDHANYPDEDHYRYEDAAEYSAVADNLLSGKGWWSPDRGGQIYHHGPVFPLYVAGIRALGASLFTVTLVNALVGALTCWGVVLLARRLTSREGALLAGLAMAVYPYFIHYTAKILTETLSIFFGLLLFATLLRFSRGPGALNAIVAGLVLGLATLNHPETYIAPPLLLLWIVAAHPERMRALKGLALLFVVFGLTLLPWHAYHAVRSGKNILLPPSLGADGVLSQAALDAKGRIEGNPAYFNEARQRLNREGKMLEEAHGVGRGTLAAVAKVMQDAIDQPGEYLHFVALKFKGMWGLAPEYGVYKRPWIVIPTGALNLLLYAGFMAGLVLYRPREEAVLALTLVVIYTIPHLIYYAQPRYKLPVMPVVIIFAGVTANALLMWVKARRRPVEETL